MVAEQVRHWDDCKRRKFIAFVIVCGSILRGWQAGKRAFNMGGANYETESAFGSLPRLKSLRQPIMFRGPINAYTGYGLHACQVITDLSRMGHPVKVRPVEIGEKFSKVPLRIRKLFVGCAQPDEWELLLYPPHLPPTAGKRTVFFTMWEASRLPRRWVETLNKAECVVVPCKWNATSFRASGVKRPVRVVPLGIKTEIFPFVPMNMAGPCVFGTAGRLEGGGKRKGLQEMISLFQKAFPAEQDVQLKIKCFPDCGIPAAKDARIKITARFLTERQMASWYASLTSFVSISRSEGWGLMPQQAMAMGRPCIMVKFGGHAEFFNEGAGYCVDFKLEPAGFNYSGSGFWAEPDKDHVIELMRRVYRNRREACALGLKATQIASAFTWQRSNRALLRILEEVGMVS